MSAWTVIAHTEVGSGGSAEISFTSIPATYTDLFIVYSLRSTNAVTDMSVRYNGASANYSMRLLYGDGTSTGSASNASTYLVWAGQSNSSAYTASTFSNGSIYIPNYAGNTNKSSSHDGVTENNGTASIQMIAAGLWSDTSAITSIALSLAAALGGNIVQYSSATLYGITKGSSGGVTVS